MEHILFIEPIFKEMIWGGHKLQDEYGYAIPSQQTGECWAISAHQNGDCKVANGEYQGVTLSTLYKEHRELFGNINAPQFPLLVKIIDANRDLSVQVHPDNEYASQHELSMGKTECWYVLGADDKTKMVMGHHAKTKAELIQCIEEDNYDYLLNKFEIKPGDFYYIPAGTIHAICAGSLIYEAQQSSDITYRVYDYHRKDKAGNERLLHVQQSIDVATVPYCPIDINQTKVEQGKNYTKTELIKAEYFSVTHLDITGNTKFNHQVPFSLVSVIEGNGMINQHPIQKGQHFIVCSDVQELCLSGCLTLMITSQ